MGTKEERGNGFKGVVIMISFEKEKNPAVYLRASNTIAQKQEVA